MYSEWPPVLAGAAAFSNAISKCVLRPMQKNIGIADGMETIWPCFCVKTTHHAGVDGRYQAHQPCQMDVLDTV